MRRLLTALALAVVLVAPQALLGAPPAAAQESSAATLPGTGDFAGLRVTVAQTRNLIDQVVRVSWTGGAPTERVGGTGPVAGNFLQIMQCWGAESGPERTQCEYGAAPEVNGTPRSVYGRPAAQTPPVPGELPAPAADQGSYFLPFRAVGTPAPTTLAAGADTNPFFDQQLTNEVPVALTRADGTGEVDFEMQSAAQSAGLGCGRPDTTTGVVQPCWLVVVPRDNRNANGTVRDPTTSIAGTPLDPRLWENRIQFRLDFAATSAVCPFGITRPITGHEMVTDAVGRWQRSLCAEGQDPFSFTRINDQLVRSQAVSLDPDLGIVTEPVPPEQVPADRPLVYAPVAINALTLAFNVDAQPIADLLPADDPRLSLRGTPITEITLNARLVAKLLTQSYLFTVAADGDAVAAGHPVVDARPARLQGNPQGLFLDPEFFELNPDLANLLSGSPHPNPLIQIGTSDLTGLLWDWVLADPDARAWIDGATDAGTTGDAARRTMVVNPANRGIRPPLDAYPRNDLLCAPVGPIVRSAAAPDVFGEYCPLDRWPATDDMAAAARNAARGDSLSRNITVTTNEVSPSGQIRFPAVGRQPSDQQQVMAVVDAATADRYRLPMVKLVNAAGVAVAPDAAGLAAAVDAMRPSGVEGVVVPDPATTNPAAYPLTAISYAVTAPTVLDDPQAAPNYARFLRYAVGPGQTLGEGAGQLPFGYLPLPQAMRDQTLAAADTIERLAVATPATPQATPTPPAPPAPPAPSASQPAGTTPGGGAGLVPPGPAASGGAAVGGTGTGTGSGAAAVGGADAAEAGGAAVAPVDPAEAPVALPAVVPAAQPTPAVTIPGNVGAVLVSLFVVGGLAAAIAPATQMLGRRFGAQRGGVAS